MNIDPREYRRTIGLFATGVTVITVRVGGVTHGMTANAVTSVSIDPLLTLVCIQRQARMSSLIVETDRFAINVLNEQQESLSRHFASRAYSHEQVAFDELHGVPILPQSLATLVCTVERVLDGGDHLIVLGRVEALSTPRPTEPPLLFYAGKYRQLAVES